MDVKSLVKANVPGVTDSANKSAVKKDPPPPDLNLSRTLSRIADDRWDSTLPYVFTIVQADEDGKVTDLSLDDDILGQIPILSSNQFVLRIPPSSLNINTQYAISVTATNGGILEEHNGIIFRMITISGSFGVLPDKGTRFEKPPGGMLGIAANIFPAAASAIGSLGGAIRNAVSSVIGNGGEAVPLDGENRNHILDTSGYSQFWQLHNFIGAYVQAQKDPSIEDELRLVFSSQKDSLDYVVTPLVFELRRDAGNPMLYRYNIVMRAWDLAQSNVDVKLDPPFVPSPNNVTLIKSILNTIKSSRSTMQSARNVLSGIHSDIDSIFDIYNQSVLFLADTAGLVNDVRTFGSTIDNNRQSLFLNSARNQRTIGQALQDDLNATSQTRLLGNAFKETSSPSNIPAQSSKTAILFAGGARGTTLNAKTPAEAMIAATDTGASTLAAVAAADAIAKQSLKAAKRASRNLGVSGAQAAIAVAQAASLAASQAAAQAGATPPTAPEAVSTSTANPNSVSPIPVMNQGVPFGAVSSSIAKAAFSSAKTTPGGEDKISGGKTANQTVSPQTDSAIQKAFTLDSLLDLPITSFDLPPDLKTTLNNQVIEARNTNAGDIRELTDKLQEISDNFAKSLGSLDPDYARIYGVPIGSTVTTKQATEDDILLAVALQEAKISFTSMLATGEILKEKEPDPFLAANTVIPASDQLRTPRGSTVVAYERGASLERMAQIYLGDAKRAREIAILNGLRAPYIDEMGFTQPISSVAGRIFIITGADRFTMGQVIVIRAATLPSTRRRIVALDDIGGGKFRITVDGPATLDFYVPVLNPFIFARLPGTIGSGDVLLMPSANGPNDPVQTRPTPLFTRLNHAEKVFKVDILLSEGGKDLAVSANQDLERAFGYANAAQAIRLALETEQGENERHLNYGLPVPIGERTNDLTLEQLKSIVQQRIQTDGRFIGAQLEVVQDESATRIFVVAEGASGTGTIPLSFEIGRQ